MANRCYQTVRLFGKAEKIKEVIDYVQSEKEIEYEDGSFIFSLIPDSLTKIVGEDCISFETKYCSVGMNELSKKFPEVGFRSGSFTDGAGDEELCYYLDGILLYYHFENVQYPKWWKKITGNEIGDLTDIRSIDNIEIDMQEIVSMNIIPDFMDIKDNEEPPAAFIMRLPEDV